ncbi:MAG: hypothetical protein N0E54_11535, partial [Candidatus Thiodiazotropha taylori]|nr:hypothetical protein [Candidatus Thiodiazotropha endolucinida]MCW4229362.1 hypothetical protein [Candidatus Thiodiazotropha taylori]
MLPLSRQTLSTVAATAIASLSTNSVAEEAAQSTTLDEISVTATRVEKPLETVPAAVGIVQQQTIQFAEPQLGLDESLTQIPGIFM